MSEMARSRRRTGWRAPITVVASICALLAVLAMPTSAEPSRSAAVAPAATFPGTGSSRTAAWVQLISHAPHSLTSNRLTSTIAVSDHTTRGRASAAANAATSISRHAGTATVHSKGSLHAKATCLQRSCPGDGQVADAAASTDADIKVNLGAVGAVPYRLQLSLHAGGQTEGPCAAVRVRLIGAESLDVAGPSGTSDCGAPTPGGSLSVIRDGILQSNGRVALRIDAQTGIMDPSHRRSDKLHAAWDVTLTLGPRCTIAATDDPTYDVHLGATVNGTPGNDVICGGDGPDIIHGNGGIDKVYGGGGADTIDAQGLIVGGGGPDYLCGSAGDDTIFGGDDADTIEGGPGADLLDGGAGSDVIFGDVEAHPDGPGCHVPDGPAGADIIMGDGPIGASGKDVIQADGGNDSVNGGGDDDIITGGPGKDTLTGGPGKDALDGGAGKDQIRARDGETDTVSCGPGTDTATLDHIDQATGCEHKSF